MLFRNLFLLFSLYFLSVFSNNLNAQTGISFECGGYEFTLYPDSTPLKFSYKVGDKISYDYQGRVSYIGNLRISYDYQGRVSYIGNLRISYDYQGRVSYIGSMRISYDYQGRISGTSGSLDCNF